VTTEDQATTVADNPAKHRFEIVYDGVLAGFADYRDRDDVRSFLHTEIQQALEGRGLASQLIRTALDETRAAGFGVLPFCPFVRSYIHRHPEYAELVPADHRARFDLEMHEY
jgi:predicted GNAT family acetyltransferase